MKRGIWILWGTLFLSMLTQPAFAPAESIHALRYGNNHADASAQNRILTPLAQAAISAAIGRDRSIYHAKALPGGIRLEDPQTNLRATFTRQGVRIGTATPAGWGLAFEEYGTGKNLQAVELAEPRAESNRVEYRRGPVTEWYVNGPAGLEQGFTIARAPTSGKSGTLTLALAMSGNLKATVDAARTGVTLSNGKGLALLRYGGLTAFDAGGRELHSWLEVRSEQLLVRVDTTGALFPVTVDPWVQVARLTASDAAPSDFLAGVSVSADGSTVVAAAINANSGRGAAYVFVKPFTGWANLTETAKLTASDGAPGGRLGPPVSVSADGSTVVLGASFVDIGSKDNQGAAYVFVKPSTGWANLTETAKLVASDGAANDEMGGSVSISADGSTVVAGAAHAGVGSNFWQGAAYVFVSSSGNWTDAAQVAKLAASDGRSDDRFGDAVSTNGDGSTVVVAAPYALVGGNYHQGAAYIYLRPSGGWATTSTFNSKLTASDGGSYDLLGLSVSVSADGSTVVAGKPISGQGAAYVFVKPSGGWAPTLNSDAKLTASDGTPGDYFGWSVSTSADGSTVLVGARRADSLDAPDAGAAYVFTKPPTGWTTTSDFVAKFTTPTPQDNAQFGYSVGVSADGLTAAVDAVYATVTVSEQGAAYVFSGASASQFEVDRLDVSGGPHTTFEMGGRFVLAAANNGIDPATEPVTLVIGSQVLAIPAGSFALRGSGNYIFAGVIDNVRGTAQIRYLGAYAYAFHIQGSGADLACIKNPVTVTLSIGDDSGTAQVNAQIH